MTVYAYTRETPGGKTQREKLKKEIELLKNEDPDELVIEKASAGKKKFDAFRKLFDKLRPEDTLVIPSIDRISHSADDFSGLVAGLANRGVTLRVLNLGTFDHSPEGATLKKAVNAFAVASPFMAVQKSVSGFMSLPMRAFTSSLDMSCRVLTEDSARSSLEPYQNLPWDTESPTCP